MNGAIGVAELLLDTPPTTEQRSYLEIIRSSGDSLLRIISDVLNLSKIEGEMLCLEELEFDLPALIKEALALLGVVAREKGLDVTVEVDPAVPVSVQGVIIPPPPPWVTDKSHNVVPCPFLVFVVLCC